MRPRNFTGGVEVNPNPKACVVLAVCAIIFLELAGCGSDSCGPADCHCEITLENVWPNDDGRSWEYEFTWRVWDDTCEVYENEDDVPPAPSLDEIESLMRTHPTGPNVTARIGTYTIAFRGDSTSMSGVTAQRLREASDFPDGTHEHAGTLSSVRRLLTGHSFDDIAVHGTANGDGPALLTDPILPVYPLLIHGGVWEKTDDYIGTYGDIDTLLAWKFLGAGLCRGSEFTFRLIPSVEGERYLHCRILGRTGVETEMGVFENGLHCLYLVDLGIAQVGLGGGPTGWRRQIVYGEAVYVPDVGPVYAYERQFACVEETVSYGTGDMELSLIRTGKD